MSFNLFFGVFTMRFALSKSNQSLPLSCESIGYNWDQHKVYRPTGYNFFHWLYVEHGCGYLTIENQTIKLSTNQGILIAPNVPHSYYPDSTNTEWKTSFLTFYGAATATLADFINIKNYIYVPNVSDEIANFIPKYFKNFAVEDINHLYFQSSLIYHFMMLMQKNINNLNQDVQLEPIINTIINYFEKEYRYPITNQDIANHTGYSISYGNELFKKVFAVTPLQYLTEYRLRKAKYFLICRKDLKVHEISELVGFQDVSRFVQLFKLYNNLTPAKYRKTMH